MATLNHPHKAAIAELRKVIRGADSSILEGVKWNAPSFRTTGYFATTHLLAKSGLAVILHLGAKARPGANPDIKDPKKLLDWLAKDRAIVSFEDLQDLRAKAGALQSVIRQWIRYVA